MSPDPLKSETSESSDNYNNMDEKIKGILLKSDDDFGEDSEESFQESLGFRYNND